MLLENPSTYSQYHTYDSYSSYSYILGDVNQVTRYLY